MGRLSARPAAKPASRPRADWSSLYDWQTIDRTTDTPVVHQIYLQIRSAILTRRLQPGTRLPSSRALATRLQVARSSVIEACEQLHAEGYLMSRIGSGTFVSSDLPAAIERPRRADARQAAPVIDKTRRVDAILDNPTPCETRPFNTGRTTLDPRTPRGVAQAVPSRGPHARRRRPRLFGSAGTAGIQGGRIGLSACSARGGLHRRPDPDHRGHAACDRHHHSRAAAPGRQGVGRGPRLPVDATSACDSRHPRPAGPGRSARPARYRRHHAGAARPAQHS